MKFKFILGIDMSKEWFNYCLMDVNFVIIKEGEVINAPDTIFAFLSELIKHSQVDQLNEIILVLEHTGIYVQHLVSAWLSKGGRLSLVAATKVSEQLGGKPVWDEKTDQLDARRLAEYGIRYTDKLVMWQAKEHLLVKLQSFHRQRSRLIDVINILEVPIKESKQFDTAEISQALMENQSNSIEVLKADLKRLEKELSELIQQDSDLGQLFTLIVSVSGIGPVTAREIIIATSAFKDFSPSDAKSFARYAGVVPLRKQSGKMKRRKRINKNGNKKIKTLLTMGATSLIGTRSELGIYYDRKIKEGKLHFSVINAMRNKLILRIFAVVRNQVIYQKNLNYCLDLP